MSVSEGIYLFCLTLIYLFYLVCVLTSVATSSTTTPTSPLSYQQLRLMLVSLFSVAGSLQCKPQATSWCYAWLTSQPTPAYPRVRQSTTQESSHEKVFNLSISYLNRISSISNVCTEHISHSSNHNSMCSSSISYWYHSITCLNYSTLST